MTVTINGTTGITSPGGDTNASLTSSGNQTAAAMIPTGSTVPANGVFLPASNAVGVATNSTERMRIDSSGNLLVGTTAVDPIASATNGLAYYTANATIRIRSSTASIALGTNASGDMQQFYYYNGSTNTKVGSISNTTTATSYNTSSDYRLKENIQPMLGALDVVAQLNPVTYTWKADGSDGQGFIAHELQAVVPDCVTGEKDAVDEEGNPVYQGIDTSFLVATLTKAIQELSAKVDAQQAEIEALKGVQA